MGRWATKRKTNHHTLKDQQNRNCAQTSPTSPEPSLTAPGGAGGAVRSAWLLVETVQCTLGPCLAQGCS